MARRETKADEENRRRWAHSLLHEAVREGFIERPPGKVFHHPDYSRPFYGCWLTPADHTRLHCKRLDGYWAKVRAQAAEEMMVDYWPGMKEQWRLYWNMACEMLERNLRRFKEYWDARKRAEGVPQAGRDPAR